MNVKEKVKAHFDKVEKELYTLNLSEAIAPDNLVIQNPDINITYAGVDYKYNEGKSLEEIRKYINATYGEHYSRNNYQATEFIIDGGHGTGFCIGNVLKYAQRYGHKGDAKEWRKDLLKVIHYAIIQLHVHDLEHKKD